MLVTPYFIFLRLQKMATTSIRIILARCVGKNLQKIKTHHGIDIVDESDYKDKLIISSFRNPYYWYRSWWVFTNRNNEYSRKKNYELHDDPLLFQNYMLRLKNDPSYLSKYARYKTRPYYKNIGLLTHMYLNMYFKNQQNLNDININDLLMYDKKYCCVDNWLFVETFANDMQELLEKFNMINEISSIYNTHIRLNKYRPLKEYYTQEIFDYVRKTDKFILQKFNYSFPFE